MSEESVFIPATLTEEEQALLQSSGSSSSSNGSVSNNENQPPEVVQENVVYNVHNPDEFEFQLVAFDPDGDGLTFQITTQPQHGALSLLDFDNQIYQYTPAEDFEGDDQLTYLANDGIASTQAAMVSFQVAKNTVPRRKDLVDIKKTFVLDGNAIATILQEQTRERQAELIQQAIFDEFELDDFDTEHENVGFNFGNGQKTISKTQIQGSAGFSGYICAWEIKGKEKTNGLAYDFTGTKIRFMAFQVILSNQTYDRDVFVTGDQQNAVEGPGTTKEHETMHTDGAKDVQKALEKKGYRFVSNGELTQEKDLYSSPGMNFAANAYHTRLYNVLRRTKPDGVLTNESALADAKALVSKWFTGTKPRNGILNAGFWHAANLVEDELTGNLNYQYLSLEWHPNDIVGKLQ